MSCRRGSPGGALFGFSEFVNRKGCDIVGEDLMRRSLVELLSPLKFIETSGKVGNVGGTVSDSEPKLLLGMKSEDVEDLMGLALL